MGTAVLIILLAVGTIRNWTDSSGEHTIKAELIDVQMDGVRLRTTDGKLITLPLSKLSPADREFVRRSAKSSASPRTVRPAPAKAASSPSSTAATKTKHLPVAACVNLPALGSADSVSLLPIGREKVSLELVAPNSSPCDFYFQPADDANTWKIITGAHKAAYVVQREQALEIRWDPSIPAKAECLRNAVLVVRQGNKSTAIALRDAVEIASSHVDLQKAFASIPIGLPLCGLEAKDLKLEAIGITGGPGAVRGRTPVNGRVDHSKPARLVLRAEKPEAGLELKLQGVEEIVVRIEPYFLDFADRRGVWTDRQLKSLRTAFVNSINQHLRDIPKAEAAIPQMQSQISALQGQYDPKAPNARFVAEAIAKSQAALAATQARLATMQHNLPGIQQRGQAFTELFGFSEQVHKKVQVELRAFYISGEYEVTLIRVKSS